jgi:hypothetical protein
MKKITLIETIIDFMASDSAGDLKGIYHPEIVKVHLNNVFNQLIYNTWLNGKKFSDFSQLDAWSRTYLGMVVSQSYVQLPFAPIQLPDMAGIRQVSDHANPANVFAPIESTSNVVFAELEVNTMDNTPTYRLELMPLALITSEGELSHRLILEKLPVAPSTLITYVDVMMVVPMEVMGDYDEISLPQEMGDSIIRQVVDLMSRKGIPDTANDQVIQK